MLAVAGGYVVDKMNKLAYINYTLYKNFNECLNYVIKIHEQQGSHFTYIFANYRFVMLCGQVRVFNEK
jgi:hypothetical protein